MAFKMKRTYPNKLPVEFAEAAPEPKRRIIKCNFIIDYKVFEKTEEERQLLKIAKAQAKRGKALKEKSLT
jgi:hypothetical protein